jgi:hypothetical protein
MNSVNDSDEMSLRNDTPGCVHHEKGETFGEIYLGLPILKLRWA